LKSHRVLWLIAAVVIPAVACATATGFRSTWRNPTARPVTLAGQKIVALVISTQDVTRRAGEDAVAQQISARGAQGVPAWTMLPTADIQAEDRTKAAFAEAGAAGVVTLEIVPSDRNSPSISHGVTIGSTSRQSFWGNYRWAWSHAWHSGPAPNSSVWVETLVYSLQPDELLWAGRSRTVNAGAAERLFAEVAQAAANEMDRAGLLKPAAQ
jgi:hypothetical protein